MSATTLLLVRHGETDWNRDRRVQGHTDVPLNDEGRSQARTLAATLDCQEFAAIYSSDLARALETAKIIAEPCGLEVTPVEALREKDFGTWEGLTDVEILTRFPDAHATGWGDGESTEELATRVLQAVDEIGAEHPDEAVIVVTHGGPLRALLRSCGAADGPIANCHAVRLAHEDGVLLQLD